MKAQQFYQTYKPYVFTVISDATFRRNGRADTLAGFDFLRTIRAEILDLPLLMISNFSGE